MRERPNGRAVLSSVQDSMNAHFSPIIQFLNLKQQINRKKIYCQIFLY